MEHNDIEIILDRLNKVYEDFNYTSSMSYEWLRAFQNKSYREVNAAVEAYIDSNNKPPTIDKIKSYLPGKLQRYDSKRWEDSRKWRWKLDKVKKTLDNGREIETDEVIQVEMQYHVNKFGDIVDELGRIFADPDDDVQQQLVNKVKATGKLV